ncbi:MAG: N-6 DNA methylase [Bacteroidetes bacterium]|nr:N-6 DNA methylase [Bacteroidota bacterium]
MIPTQKIFETYIHSIKSKFKFEETSEMGYRTDFEILLKGIFESINVNRIDHDAKAIKGNKPDFRILKFGVPILYIEAKDIGVSLDKIEKSEQMTRYFGYANLVLTDYVEFRFYRNGERYDEPIKIADYNIHNRTIDALPENFEHAAKTLIDFTQSHKEPIKSGLHLAKIMGGKAQRIRDNLLQFLSVDSEKNSEIIKIYKTLKKLLVHDLETEAFADMYAQTLVYGLFVARYFDDTPNDFTRREAQELVPKSNPFLRQFFNHITGADFDKRLEYIVDELCLVFSHANIPHLMKQYFKDDLWGKTQEGPDPVIHFYEDFLREYDAELRKKMGAYYTPQPVVRFIVRAVDYLLAEEFGLPNGLADTTKLQNEIHKVQILDPAVGTGTFINSVIELIYEKILNAGQKGTWPSYVLHNLLPRVHGFELMMSPYTIAHLKISMNLKSKGFKYFNNRRFGIYLTNSLEEADDFQLPFSGFGFAESIAEESKEASLIKNDTPIMVVIGNPPYNVSSSNKGKWITDLIKDYKKDLNERNIQPLSDDYIKFIRYAEHYIEKNKTGIVAMITNNTFLDGIIHRQMRKHLLETFDEIYVLDLHGNAKKKETAPDGSKDENVFDIQQGVAISIMIRKSEKKDKLGIVKYYELYGKRDNKFLKLIENDLSTIRWETLNIIEPKYFFVPKDFSLDEQHITTFNFQELFTESGSGVKFRKDSLLVKNHYTSESVKELLGDINEHNDDFIHSKYKFKDTFDWKLKDKRKLFLNAKFSDITLVQYRPFDYRFTYYPLDKISEIIPRGDSRKNLMKHFLFKKNIGLVTKRGQDFDSAPCFITNSLIEIRIYSPPGVQGTDYVFPLYLYSKDGTRVPNLKIEIVKEIENIVGKIEPEEILDYIYAVLHSPNYREKFKEFLKIDFPRVPYPKDKKTFKELVKLGTEIRLLHLLESPKVNQFITTFPKLGSDTVEKVIYKNENVIINEEQYFGKVPESAWNFYIGGYQPAQKWLKDRKGRKLTNEEIDHYQKIIVALVETERIMKEIDEVVNV